MAFDAETVAEMCRRIAAMPQAEDQHVALVNPELFRMMREDALAAGAYIPSEPLAYLDHVKRSSPKLKLSRHVRSR